MSFFWDCFRRAGNRTQLKQTAQPPSSERVTDTLYERCFVANEIEHYYEVASTPRVLHIAEKNGRTSFWFQRNYYAANLTVEGNRTVLAFVPVAPRPEDNPFDMDRALAESGVEWRREREYYRIRTNARSHVYRVFHMARQHFGWSGDTELKKTYSDTPPERN